MFSRPQRHNFLDTAPPRDLAGAHLRCRELYWRRPHSVKRARRASLRPQPPEHHIATMDAVMHCLHRLCSPSKPYPVHHQIPRIHRFLRFLASLWMWSSRDPSTRLSRSRLRRDSSLQGLGGGRGQAKPRPTGTAQPGQLRPAGTTRGLPLSSRPIGHPVSREEDVWLSMTCGARS